MKKFLVLLLMPFAMARAQYPIYTFYPQVITQNIHGGTIQKNDTIAVTIKLNGNGSTVRSTYFDFQHQFTAISLIDVTMATAGAQGSALPAGTSTSVQNYFYPNCKLNRSSQNTTTSSWTNYQYANYTCNSNTVPNDAINRIMANVSGNTNLGNGDYMYLRFKITNITAGFPYDSIRMNFAAGYQSNGNQQTSTLGEPHASWVQLATGANNLVTGNIALPANLTVMPMVAILDSITNGLVTTKQLTTNGNFGFSTELQPNTAYKLYVLWDADSLAKLSTQATTVSDYTTAFQEFLSQNLDGTYKNNNLTRGVRFKAADVSKNGIFDGGDVQLLFNAISGIDTVLKKPSGAYASWDYESVYVMPVAIYDTISAVKWNNTTTNWPNHYGFTTTNSNQTINLKYLLLGDPNLSMSSPLSAGYNLRMSNVNGMIPSIDVNLNNTIVTTNTITIPFEIDTKSVSVSALQFQVEYDTTKVKFDKLIVDTPSWISFATPSSGTLRFGAIDKDMKTPITGKLTPFKLQFISLQGGIDINSYVTISPIYDGADSKGNQVIINLNTTVVKLIGANNFKTP
jgi:hypothetical protein